MDKETDVQVLWLCRDGQCSGGHTAIAELNEAEVDGSVDCRLRISIKGAGRPSSVEETRRK